MGQIFLSLSKIVKENGGKFISTGYVLSTEKYTIECKKGHQWQSRAGAIKIGRWCPCLDKKYVNVETNMKFECRNGHIKKINWQRFAAKKTFTCKECIASMNKLEVNRESNFYTHDAVQCLKDKGEKCINSRALFDTECDCTND